jgi:hypothetical protein
MQDDPPLTQASPADLEQALAHALQYDGRKPFKPSGEMMAKITAAHLVECLVRAGFVLMQKPPGQGQAYCPGKDRQRAGTASRSIKSQ